MTYQSKNSEKAICHFWPLQKFFKEHFIKRVIFKSEKIFCVFLCLISFGLFYACGFLECSLILEVVYLLELIWSTILKGDVTIRNFGLVLVSPINTVWIAVTNPIFFDANSSAPFSVFLTSEFSFRITLPGLAL